MCEVECMDEAEADHDNSIVADHPHHWMIESPTGARSEGVCNICRNHEYKTEKIYWKAREAELHELIKDYRGKGGYDCIIPFSGGKDSTFTLWYIVAVLKLKPLVVSFDHGSSTSHSR